MNTKEKIITMIIMTIITIIAFSMIIGGIILSQFLASIISNNVIEYVLIAIIVVTGIYFVKGE